jgi:hypothetical protein
MSAKTQIYTWRVSPATKARLEDAARTRGRSVARLLDELVTEGLDRATQDPETEAKRQQALHRKARRFAGCLSGGAGSRRSERVRDIVRARLSERRGRAR